MSPSPTRVALRHIHADAGMHAGIDIRSYNQRRAAWWDDLGELIKEWWSLEKVTVRKVRGRMTALVDFRGGRRNIEIDVKGPESKPTVYVWAAERSFGSDHSLLDIIYWIDKVTRP